MQLATLLVPLVLLSPGALAQHTVWIVDDDGGPGVFSIEIQPAVDAAAEGDLIVVRPGDYRAPVLIDGKALSVVGDGEAGFPQDVRLWGEGITVRNLDAHQTVVLRSLDVRPGLLVPASSLDGLACEDDLGLVIVEDCYLTARSSVSTGVAARITSCDEVVFSRTVVQGVGGAWGPDPTPGHDGLHMVDSHVALFDSEVRGGSGGDNTDIGDGAGGGDAVRQEEGRLYGSGTLLRRGFGGAGDGLFGQCGPNGRAQRVLGDSPTVWHLDDTIQGSVTASPGALITTLPGTARSFEVERLVSEGATMHFTFAGEPGDEVFLVASSRASSAFLLDHHGVLLPAAPARVIPLGPVTASGELVVPRGFGDLPAELGFLRVHLQGILITPGGERYVSAPSVLHLLDGAL